MLEDILSSRDEAAGGSIRDDQKEINLICLRPCSHRGLSSQMNLRRVV